MEDAEPARHEKGGNRDVFPSPGFCKSGRNGDVLPEGWEIANGLAPNASDGDDGAAADLDGAG